MNLTPQYFIISDLHFGHKGILKFGTRTATYQEDILNNWNAIVGKNDKVLCLGDLTLTGKEKSLEYFKQFNGEKYLILGNHDNHSISWYEDLGFKVIEPIFKRMKDGKGNEYFLVITHEPIEIPANNYFNLHGHLHGSDHHEGGKTEHHFDASCECINFTPIKLSEILTKFEKQLEGGENNG